MAEAALRQGSAKAVVLGTAVMALGVTAVKLDSTEARQVHGSAEATTELDSAKAATEHGSAEAAMAHGSISIEAA